MGEPLSWWEWCFSMAVTNPNQNTESRRISILGSTGSVGCNTIDLIKRNRKAYEIEALTARSNVDLLIAQALEFQPQMALENGAR